MRNSSLEFYLTRAAEARAEGAAATLDHVRERCHRSEAAWTALADRVVRTDAMRATHEKMKAEQPPQ